MTNEGPPLNTPAAGFASRGRSGRAVDLMDYLEGQRRAAAAVQADVWFQLYVHLRAICAFSPLGEQEHQLRRLFQRVGFTQNTTWRAASRQISTAYTLHYHFPQVCQHVRDGDFTPAIAEVIADESTCFTRTEQFDEYLAKVLPRALTMGMTPARLRRYAKRIAETLNDTPIEERSPEQLARERYDSVRATDLGEGVVALRIIMSAVDGYAVASRVQKVAKLKQQVARQSGKSTPPRAFLEHETATELLTGALDPEYAGVRGEIRITVPLLSLETGSSRHTQQELHERVNTLAGLSGHATLDGYGPVAVPDIDQVCAMQREWYRMFIDPATGGALATDSRVPSAALKRFLNFRDPTCRWVGCEVRAEHADADHTIPWSVGGKTSAENLSHLCRRHHVLKHHGGLHLKQLGDGVLEWQLPNGERVIDEPERMLPQPAFGAGPPNSSDPPDDKPPPF